MNPLNRLVASSLPFVPKSIVSHFAKRYIAGGKFDDAASAVHDINTDNMMATIDLLGEDATTEKDAIAAREACKNVLGEISHQHLDSNLSVKLTQLGLKLDRQFCTDNLLDILEVARQVGNFVRIDMEDSTCTDDTLEIYRAARKSFDNVGVAIQAYLRRSEADVRELVKENANIRLCKGIYVESEQIAFQGREEVQENFVKLLGLLVENRCYVGIATHDDAVVRAAYRLVQSMQLNAHEYEFQMLLGVRRELRSQIVQRGHRMRIYVPFGEHWYEYSIRRLKENPRIVGNILRSVFTSDHAA